MGCFQKNTFDEDFGVAINKVDWLSFMFDNCDEKSSQVVTCDLFMLSRARIYLPWAHLEYGFMRQLCVGEWCTF